MFNLFKKTVKLNNLTLFKELQTEMFLISDIPNNGVAFTTEWSIMKDKTSGRLFVPLHGDAIATSMPGGTAIIMICRVDNEFKIKYLKKLMTDAPAKFKESNIENSENWLYCELYDEIYNEN